MIGACWVNVFVAFLCGCTLSNFIGASGAQMWECVFITPTSPSVIKCWIENWILLCLVLQFFPDLLLVLSLTAFILPFLLCYGACQLLPLCIVLIVGSKIWGSICFYEANERGMETAMYLLTGTVAQIEFLRSQNWWFWPIFVVYGIWPLPQGSPAGWVFCQKC